jgi:hypothetical protein
LGGVDRLQQLDRHFLGRTRLPGDRTAEKEGCNQADEENSGYPLK